MGDVRHTHGAEDPSCWGVFGAKFHTRNWEKASKRETRKRKERVNEKEMAISNRYLIQLLLEMVDHSCTIYWSHFRIICQKKNKHLTMKAVVLGDKSFFCRLGTVCC